MTGANMFGADLDGADLFMANIGNLDANSNIPILRLRLKQAFLCFFFTYYTFFGLFVARYRERTGGNNQIRKITITVFVQEGEFTLICLPVVDLVMAGGDSMVQASGGAIPIVLVLHDDLVRNILDCQVILATTWTRLKFCLY